MSIINDMEVWKFHTNSNGDPVRDGDVPPDNPYKVMLGVELELENVRNAGDNPRGWVRHQDDSLRNGIEFVFNGGKSGVSFTRAIDAFYAMNLTFTKGPRTSTHIHINVGDATLGAVRSMYAISYALEDAVFRVLGAKRKYCGYCMPLTEQRPNKIVEFLTSDDRYQVERVMMGNNAEKYYGFNINSIRKHGTVELRYFPGGPTKDELLEWCLYATNLKQAAMATTLADLAMIDTPADMEVWLRAKFGEFGQKMLDIVGAEGILNHLTEVLAMLPDDDIIQRQDQLVFITSPLAKTIGRIYGLRPDQQKFFEKRVNKLGVLGMDEWQNQVAAARMHRGTVGADEVSAGGGDYYVPAPRVAPPRPARPAPRARPFDVEWAALNAQRGELVQPEAVASATAYARMVAEHRVMQERERVSAARQAAREAQQNAGAHPLFVVDDDPIFQNDIEPR